MNPIFETGSGDALRAGRDPLTLSADLESTVRATEECRPIVGATVGADLESTVPATEECRPIVGATVGVDLESTVRATEECRPIVGATVGEDLESTVAATVAGDEYFALTVGRSVSEKRRVLLIDGDACTLETIRYYLAESGYGVAAFQSSRDGLGALMADDFALLLYDPTAPGLRGDVFYDSVDRIDPELCERIVFMIGEHVDARTTKFIENINGFVLRKPFDSLNLLDAILSAETTGSLEGVFERAGSAADTGTPDEAGASPLPCADAAGKPVPNEPDAAALKNGPVLLIEPDSCFRETVRYYLAETGYPVVAIQNSRVALKEVLAGDFALLLYDPTAPGLPADMFYQGIRRIDPELCERLVFMIGDRVDASTSAFLKKIDGFVLRKPFDAKILADKIAATEVLGTFRGAFESASTDPGLSQACLSDEDATAAGTPRPQVTWFAETLSEPPAVAQPVSAPGQDPVHLGSSTEPVRLSDVVPPLESEALASGPLRVFAFAGFVLLTALIAIRWSQFADARERVASASAHREALATEWAEISRSREEAISLLANIDRSATRSSRIAAFRNKERWTPILSAIVPNEDAQIEVLEVEARGETGDSGTWEVRVRGLAGGSVPQAAADRFRQAVGQKLGAKANGRNVHTCFERPDNKNGALRDQERFDFIMIATVGPMEPAVALAGEGR